MVSHAWLLPLGRLGRTSAITAANNSSVSWQASPSRSRPHARARSTYRRTVLRSVPDSRATSRYPRPSSHSRRISLISITDTSR